jgi:endonuclease YncB( thermonuclease family)
MPRRGAAPEAPGTRTPTRASTRRLMYEYRATVERVVDGDTAHFKIDLGLDLSTRMTIRLARLNTPELPTAEGSAARDYLARRLKEGEIILRTLKDRREKYGRYLGEVDVVGPDSIRRNVNDELVEKGFAKRMALPESVTVP